MCGGWTWPDTSLKHTGRRPAGVPAAPLFNTSARCTQTPLPFPWSFCSLSFCLFIFGWSSCHGHHQLSLLKCIIGCHITQFSDKCLFQSIKSYRGCMSVFTLESRRKCRQGLKLAILQPADVGKRAYACRLRIIANVFREIQPIIQKDNTHKHRQATTSSWEFLFSSICMHSP